MTKSPLPTHIGIIMDGNGRWATRQGLPRTAGHKQGVKTLEKIIQTAQENGIKILTFYAFSSENWNRGADEVATLMQLFRHYIFNDVQKVIDKGVRVSFIGDKSRFDADIADKMREIEESTAHLADFHLIFALSYGARDDIAAAAKSIATAVQKGTLDINSIDSTCFAHHLSTSGIPDPDFIIRTSGEQRLSNFLLFESAYAELYFTPTPWPDFTPTEFLSALTTYTTRHRRFGKV